MKNLIIPFILIGLSFMLVASQWGATVQNVEAKMNKENTQMNKGKITVFNAQTGQLEEVDIVMKSEDEWRAQLTDEQYYITREHGTERAFTGEYWDNKKAGIYKCVACDLDLFDAKTKFKSGTGWPSYFEPVHKNNIAEREDNSLFMRRVEVLCPRCGSHLGHVFPDGPAPTGLRYCINSGALKFVEEDKK